MFDVFCMFSSTFKKSADPKKIKNEETHATTVKIHFSSIIDEVILWRNPILIFPELIYIENLLLLMKKIQKNIKKV